MPGDMREDFAAAIEDLSKADTSGAGGAAGGEDRQPAEPLAGREPDTTPRVESKDTIPPAGQQDEKRVDPPEGEKKPDAPEGEKKPDAPAIKAPASWKPEEREAWAALPDVAKAAVIRRERQVDEALRQSTAAREFVGRFVQTIQPYQHFIQAEGSDPLTAVQNMFRTAGVLQSAPPGQKAAEVARMIQHFGVDIALLDQALTAAVQGKQAPAAPQDAIMRHLDQRLQPVMQFIERTQGAQAQSEQALAYEVQTEWETFASKPENEFAEDLRQDMADLMELAARRGVPMDLQAAYTRATLAHPTISKIVQQRKASAEAAQQTAAARRAKEAAASVGSDTPSRETGSSSGGSLREDLVASMGALAGSR